MNTERNVAVSASTNPYAPPRAAVRDIVESGVVQPADRITRLGAFFLDSIVGGLMVYSPLVLLLFASSPEEGSVDAMATLAFGLVGVGFVAWLLITFVLVKRNSQTIGKKLLHIKVVRSDGSHASLGRIFWLRNVVNGLLNIIPLYFLVDHLFIFGDAQRCLHDKLADTMVVKD
jgi:uncharacterized RDD family membrane protein YckC